MCYCKQVAVAALLQRLLYVSFIIMLLYTAMCVSSYCYILLYMCPHPTLYCSICVLILLHATASKSLVQRCCSDDNMCPHTHIATDCHICVLILLYTALCVRILQRATLQQASRCCSGWSCCHAPIYVSACSCCYICVICNRQVAVAAVGLAAVLQGRGVPFNGAPRPKLQVCRRMLTYADVCRRMLTYADVC